MRVLITGAGDGIGWALAQRYAALGAIVVGLDVDAALGERRERELGTPGHDATYLACDLARTDLLDKVLEAVGDATFDVVVHNAGISAVGAFPDIQLDEMARVIAVNLTAPMVATARLLEQDRLRVGASLVFVSSLSYYLGYPGASVYAATKDGIAHFARSVRADHPKENLHVMTVFPGPTRTAHARRYSPDNSREARRMDPARLARFIVDAQQRRKRVLIPGMANKAMACLGWFWPGAAEGLMVRALWRPLMKTNSGVR